MSLARIYARAFVKESIVERQSPILLFRQKNRWGLTVLSVVLALVIAPFTSLGLLMPQFVALLPVLMLVLLGFVGPVSVVCCGAALVGLCGFFYGLTGGVCALMLLVPLLVAATVTVERRMGFFLSVAICAGVMFASMTAILGLIALQAGTDVASALSSLLGYALTSVGDAADPMLLTLAQAGMISLPAGAGAGIADSVHITAEARGEMIAMLVYLMDRSFRLELPMQMTVGSLAAGVLGQAALRRGALSRGIAVAYPPLRTWRLPSGWGRVLGVTLAALVLAAQLTRSLSTMAYVFSGVFTELFALQGVAALCYKLHEAGKGKRTAALAFALGYFIARPIATILGIADQAFDFTHRRALLDTGDNPYDPRAKL